MRSHILVCLALAFMLAACGTKSPTAQLAPTQEPSPAPPSTAVITPEPSPTPLTMRTPVVVPDPKADPLAALRYGALPEILQTAAFTLTVAQTLGPANASPAIAAVKPLPTAETTAGVEISAADLFNFTTLSWGAVRLADPAALEASQQWQAGTRLVFSLDIVIADDFRWLRFASSPWEKEGPLGGVDADTQPLFGMLLLPEIRAMVAALGEAATAEWIEETAIDGERVHHLRFRPRLDGLHPCLLSAGLLYTPEPLPCDKGTPVVEGEAWLRTEDLTPRQLRLRVTQEGISAETKVVIDHILQFGDVNRPVQIEPPPSIEEVAVTRIPPPTVSATGTQVASGVAGSRIPGIGEILAIRTGQRGQVWVAATTGLYELKDGRWRRYLDAGSLWDVGMEVDGADRLWLLSRNDLYLLDAAGIQLQPHPATGWWEPPLVRDPEGRIWAVRGSEQGNVAEALGDGEPARVEIGDSLTRISLIAFDPQGRMWTRTDKSTDGWVSVWEGSEPVDLPLQDDFQVMSDSPIAFDERGQPWVGAFSGAGYGSAPWIAQREGEEWLKERLPVKSTANTTVVTGLEFDPQGRLWVALVYSEPALLVRDEEGWWRYDVAANAENASGQDLGPSVQALHMDTEGRLWIGTGSNVLSVDTRGDLPSPGLVAIEKTSRAAPPPTPVATRVVETDAMVMVYVPAGDFLMGSTKEEAMQDDETPQHRVYLDAYWIDRTEVTLAQYQACVEAGKCGEPDCASAGQSDLPVACVSWQDAADYCGWAGRRLPTEAEWEKAARGTDGRKYPWGNEEPDCDRLNYSGCVGNASSVGSYPSGTSPFGALDMAGNVSEWVADWYDEDKSYYATSPERNPVGPVTGNRRVVRGGAWNADRPDVLAASRSMGAPGGSGKDPGVRRIGDDLGFRCARGP
jgi:formylglycine-generating enzyme required for sulfatase activity